MTVIDLINWLSNNFTAKSTVMIFNRENECPFIGYQDPEYCEEITGIVTSLDGNTAILIIN